MFAPHLGVFVVNVPKCGSQTLDMVIERIGGCVPGHIPAAAAKAIVGPCETWALIREPWDRFTSAMNFVYGDKDISLEDAMNGALRHNTAVMLPQAHFIDSATRLFPFEALPVVIRALGYTGEAPHENASVRRWTVADIRAQARSPEVAARYSADFAARRLACAHSGPIRPLGRGEAGGAQ